MSHLISDSKNLHGTGSDQGFYVEGFSECFSEDISDKAVNHMIADKLQPLAKDKRLGSTNLDIH
jgi:hypothetical protein